MRLINELVHYTNIVLLLLLLLLLSPSDDVLSTVCDVGMPAVVHEDSVIGPTVHNNKAEITFLIKTSKVSE